MTQKQIQELNQKFAKFGYFIIGETTDGFTVQFVDDNDDLRTETATLDQLEAAYPVLQKEFDENCATLELEPAAIGISTVEAKLLEAGRYALDQMLKGNYDEANAAKDKFFCMLQATAAVFPHHSISDDLITEISCRLRLSYGAMAWSFLTP